MPKPKPPVRGAERRRIAWVRLRTRVRASLPGQLTNFLPYILQLPLLVAILIAVPVGIGMDGVDLYQREGFARARLAHIDAAIAHDQAAADSAYCRGMFATGPLYTSCAAGERRALGQFSRAWTSGKGLSTLREHMLRCFETAQKDQGMSWRIASVCAGADLPSPADTFSEG